MGKLYPPNIAGILPSFYENERGAETKISVPFSMNKTVKNIEISGFSLRIKSASTDILYGEIKSDTINWTASEKTDPIVQFNVTSLLHKFTVGSFYKVQLAYIDTHGIVGFYSTIAIIKYTAKPTVEIGNFKTVVTNRNLSEYVGTYSNEKDPTERVYKYCFTLYDKDDHILETSGWLIHNSYADTSLTESIDKYKLRYSFTEDMTYKIEYTILTNNNLEFSSPKYLVMESETIDPELKASLQGFLNYENAYIQLKLVPHGAEAATVPITGSFLLSRSSSEDNFASWLPISTLKLIGQYAHNFSFRDYGVEHGMKYIYAIQQYNDYDVYSNRICTDPIQVNFDHIYLYDGERQLKVQFNPKISSFKTNVLENKKTTIGSKYPFIFRNGSVEYKEFPISGLISLMMNDDNFSKVEYSNGINDVKTDITDNNITSERLFKLEVMNWLNNGKPKLFKSPQEGNYIVRLMNVSFSPVDQVSRMLHNFSCQATEIATYNSENLVKYKLINTDNIIVYQTRWESIDLFEEQQKLQRQDPQKTLYPTGDPKNPIRTNLITKGSGGTTYIKITDAIIGTTLYYEYANGDKGTIMIGATGAYEAYLDAPIVHLSLDNLTNTGKSITNASAFLRGIVTYSYKSTALNRFNTIKDIQTKDLPIIQTFGAGVAIKGEGENKQNETEEEFINRVNYEQKNILQYYQNIKQTFSRIYYMHFQKLQMQEINSPFFALKDGDGNLISNIKQVDLEPAASWTPNVYEVQKLDKNGNILRKYFRYYNGKLYEQPPYFYPEPPNYSNEATSLEDSSPNSYQIKTIGVLNKYTLYIDKTAGESGDRYFRFNGDQLFEITEAVKEIFYEDDKIDQAKYKAYVKYLKQTRYTDLNRFTIYHKRWLNDNKEVQEKYYIYNGFELSELNDKDINTLYNIDIKYENGNSLSGKLSVLDRENMYIDEIDSKPIYMQVGKGVCAEYGLQVKYLEYSVEDICTSKARYNEAREAYTALNLNYKVVTEEDIKKGLDEDTTYYFWQIKNNTMEKIPFNVIIDQYVNKNIKIYTLPSEGNGATKEQLQSAYETLLTKETEFIAEIQEKLNEQAREYNE